MAVKDAGLALLLLLLLQAETEMSLQATTAHVGELEQRLRRMEEEQQVFWQRGGRARDGQVLERGREMGRCLGQRKQGLRAGQQEGCAGSAV